MAIGFSGSNGGITNIYNQYLNKICTSKQSLEVSYFINNRCNLNCKHCYVGYYDSSKNLQIDEWSKTFDSLIKMGAKTFGNVGKEPLLDWDSTKMLLQYFKAKRDEDKTIRFGFVSNGLLLNEEIIQELTQIEPDYIDISLDGDQHSHDSIRGEGTYQKLLTNLTLLAETNLAKKVFISFTLNNINKHSLPEVIKTIYQIGLKNLLISPYVTLNKKDLLYLSDVEIADIISDILHENTISFKNYEHLNIYVKSDYSSSKGVMEKFKDRGIINKNDLLVDNYGVVFNKYQFGTNHIYFNYLPYDNTFTQAIRISHDGYVSGCLEMFHEDYPERAIGNIREMDISKILANYNKN